jgi:hypothetical protein
MAFTHGKNSYFQVGSHNLTGYIDNIDATETADVAETSTMGSTAKSYIVGLMDSVLALSGKWDGTTTVNEVQTLSATGTVSGGQYKLSFDGSTTADLAWNANLAAIQAAIDGLASAQGAGQIVAAGGALPGTPVTLTYSGSAWAGSSVPLMTVLAGTSPLSGGGSYGIVQTTPGTGGSDKVLQALVGAAASTFVYCPQGRGTGVGSGNVKYTGSGILTNYKQTSPIGGVVAWTADFQVTPGSLVRGTL